MMSPNGNNSPSPYEIVFNGLSTEQKNAMLQVINELQIERDDPLFLTLCIMTKAQLALEPVPDRLEALKEGIKAALQAFCEEAQKSHKEHQELNYQIYTSTERLSNILSQKLFEIERFGHPKQSGLRLPGQQMLISHFIAATLGGLFSGLLVSALLLITAR